MESTSHTRNRILPLRSLGRFIPPAARRPATAIPLLALLTLVYVVWSSLQPIEPVYLTGDDLRHWTSLVDKADETTVPVFRPPATEHKAYIADDELPPTLSEDPSLAGLSERLLDFLRRPIQTHDEAKESMRVHCPLEISDKVVNPDQYNGDSEFWKNEVSKDVIVERRLGLVRWLSEKVEQGEKVVWEEGLGKGRGIVMTAGNKVHRLSPS